MTGDADASADDWTFGDDVPDGPALAPLLIGARLGPFLLGPVLGRGAMGVVHRATDPALGRDVALKVLHAGLDAERRARLVREGELAAALDHPGIVKVHAAGEDGGRPWLAYALVEGARPLDRAWLGLARDARVGLVRDVARALGHAHARGVVHRDVKPGNVLVDRAGRARVTDLGLGRGAGLAALTATGALLGTPTHMAPEQWIDPVTVGPPADVWALGVLLYQALTGRLPFVASSLDEQRRAVLEPPPAPSTIDPTVPPGLASIALRCLVVDPAARPRDGAALALELDRARDPGRTPAADARAGGGPTLLALALTACALGLAVLLAAPGREAGRQPGTAAADGLVRRLAADARRRELVPAERERLAAALQVDGLPTATAALGHLTLARGSADEDEPWPERIVVLPALEGEARGASLDGDPHAPDRTPASRLAHARLALALDPALAAPARCAAGRALRELGEREGAARELAAAVAAGEPCAGEAARALLWTDPDQALALGRSLLARPASAREGLRIVVRALAASPDGSSARAEVGFPPEETARLEAARPELGPTPSVLAAWITTVCSPRPGGVAPPDPEQTLEAAARAWPRDAEPARALCRFLAERGRLRAAAAVAREAASRGIDAPDLAALRRADALASADPRDLVALATLPGLARRAAARALLDLGRRDVAVLAHDAARGRRPGATADATLAALDTRALAALRPGASGRGDLDETDLPPLPPGELRTATTPADRAERATRRLLLALALGDDEAALALARWLRDLDASLGRAGLAPELDRGRARDALVARALARRPDDREAHALRAERLLALGQPRAALADAQAALAGAQAALADAPGPERARAEATRAAALLELGRVDEAADRLRAAVAVSPRDVALAELLARALAASRRAGAVEAAARARALAGEHALEAAALLESVELDRASKMREELLPELDRVLALDPASGRARYLRALADLGVAGTSAQHGALRELSDVLTRAPRRLTELSRSLRTVSAARPFMRGESLERLVAELTPDDERDEPLGVAVILVHHVELDRRPELVPRALALVDRALEADPGLAVAWTLRASLDLIAGRLGEAEHDLDAADDAAPGCGQTAFYRLVLRATRGDPEPAVRRELDRAADLDFSAWYDGGWKVSLYPGLVPYVGRPGFGDLSGQHR